MPSNDNSMTKGKCLICFNNDANAVIMECGHGGICCECVKDICYKTQQCYLCRKPINSFFKLKLSE